MPHFTERQEFLPIYPAQYPSNRWRMRFKLLLNNGFVTTSVFLILVFWSDAQTPEPDSAATTVKKAEKRTAKKDKQAGIPIAATKFESFKVAPDSGVFGIDSEKEHPVYRAKQTAEDGKSETQDDQAPAKPASNGTNPAELITRIELKYQYQNFDGGDLHGIAIVRGDYAFTQKIGFRMDLPILYFNSKTPGGSSESGIGDIVTSMTFVKVFSKRFVDAVVPRIDFPTATRSSLGSGKYAFKPLVAGVTPLAKGMAFVGVLEYRISFAGNQNRADIHEMSIKPILLKSFLEGRLKGFYANPQAEFIVDFENNNRTTTQLGVNLGKVLSKNVVVFVIPTIHVAGTRRERFKLEVGFRYLFR